MTKDKPIIYINCEEDERLAELFNKFYQHIRLNITGATEPIMLKETGCERVHVRSKNYRDKFHRMWRVKDHEVFEDWLMRMNYHDYK